MNYIKCVCIPEYISMKRKIIKVNGQIVLKVYPGQNRADLKE